ncbi:MAG: hypothetical protein K6F00_10720, partial [Lachnospiraceae bacterium]|nr:hypothetical protein [Lachnospiraceae bacterium]
MRKVTIQILILLAALIVIAVSGRFAIGNTYKSVFSIYFGGKYNIDEIKEKGKLTGGDEQIATVDKIEVFEDHICLYITPKKPGTVDYEYRIEGVNFSRSMGYSIDSFLTVFDISSGGYTGDWIYIGAVSLFYLGGAVILLRFFVKSKKSEIYSYNTVFALGLSLFLGINGFVILYQLICYFGDPVNIIM